MFEQLQIRVLAGAVGEFYSPELAFCADSYSLSFSPHLPQRHIKKKKAGHSAKSAGGRFHLNMHTPLTQWSQSGLTMLSRQSVGTYYRNTHSSSGNTRPHSSQLAEPLWNDPCLKHGVGVCELSPVKKQQQQNTGSEQTVKPFPKSPCKRGISHHPQSHHYQTYLTPALCSIQS